MDGWQFNRECLDQGEFVGDLTTQFTDFGLDRISFGIWTAFLQGNDVAL